MAHPPRRLVLVVATAMVAAIVPAASASAATLNLRSPAEIDAQEYFRVVAKGTAKPNKDYGVSVIYHNVDQGKCEPTVGEEIAKNQYFSILYLYPVTTDQDGAFKVRSDKVKGGRKTSGRLCGYLTAQNGDTKDTKFKTIEFT